MGNIGKAEQRLLIGNEAIALGALRAGVTVAAGYPGTPSSEVLETIAREKGEGVYVEWSVNEKSALEVGAGAAMSGARVLVTMKQVGLNVASDPLMCLNYLGVKGGMVVMAADDPGPISSQTEQDTRHFANFAKLAAFDPSTPEEAYDMIADAFECSERIGRPVLFRPTTRVCHGSASIALKSPLPVKKPDGFKKDAGRWVIFPRLSYVSHVKIEEGLARLADEFSSYRGNAIHNAGKGKKGIAAGGVSFCHALETMRERGLESRLLKVSTVPFPAKLGLEFLRGLDEVLVAEELDPVIERELIMLCGSSGTRAVIKGKLSGDMPKAGEYSPDLIEEKILEFLGEPERKEKKPDIRAEESQPDLLNLPPRPPVLCAGCPHRSSFLAVKEASRGHNAVFSGDIGCYTLANAMPLDMVDTCLCMGAGITMAQGIRLASPGTQNFAFIGDSTFFHTGIPGIVNAVHNGSDIVVAVLDNSTTAMTGGQPHPGTDRDASGGKARKISIYAILSAIGVDSIERADAFDFESAKAAAVRALDKKGVRAILFEGACAALSGSRKEPCSVDGSLCSGCAACFGRVGCPAISFRGKKASIDGASCRGCGLCKAFCGRGAITGGGAL